MSSQIVPPQTMPSETEIRAKRAEEVSLLEKAAQEEDARDRKSVV